MPRDLRELVAWLQEFRVEHVAMESTGVYWKPVGNVLESHFQILLANGQHIKAVSGGKTDTKDCQWIAELLQHGLLRGSFIRRLVIRDLGDLTRARTSLSPEHSRIASRIQKVLQDANVKLASLASNTLGKSGRAILATIIGGEESRERLGDLALGHVRAKIPQLQAALESQVPDHHLVAAESAPLPITFWGLDTPTTETLRLYRSRRQLFRPTPRRGFAAISRKAPRELRAFSDTPSQSRLRAVFEGEGRSSDGMRCTLQVIDVLKAQ